MAKKTSKKVATDVLQRWANAGNDPDEPDEPLEQLLKPERVAYLLCVSVPTLERWRQKGDGPRFVKLNDGRQSLIRYRPETIAKFIESCERTSTKDP